MFINIAQPKNVGNTVYKQYLHNLLDQNLNSKA